MLDRLDAGLAELRNGPDLPHLAAGCVEICLAEVQNANCPTAKPADRKRAARLSQMASELLAGTD